MSSEQEWLSELRELHEADKAYHHAEEKRQAPPEPEVVAERLLEKCDAHQLMRQVQKVLLNGGGKLQFFEDVGGYHRAIVLMWQGPVSAASALVRLEDVEAAIIVGANEEGVFVNDRLLPDASVEALRHRLLKVAQEFVTKRTRARGTSSDHG